MESAKDKALEKVDQVNDFMSGSPIVKGLIDGGLSFIPFLGTAISSSLDTRAFQLFEQNSRQFAEEVRQQVKELDENKIDKEFLESNEFTSLLIEILSRNAHVHEREKVKFFATIFVNSLILLRSQTPYKEGFVRILDELDIDHINVLAFVFERSKIPLKLMKD